MKKLFTFILTLIIPFIIFAQNDYYPIQCDGEIPSDFIRKTSDKIEQANNDIRKNRSDLSRKQHKKFNSMTNYYVDYLLKSGRIVFGTSMNDYVNKVGDYVLQFYPDIKDDIRFYIVKSPYVNAFTTEQGIVFINIGLIAQLENEAQLAFVISHELIHYKYHHNLSTYSENQKANSDWGDYKTLSRNKKENRLAQYSHTQEYMADSLGFLEAFSKSEYSFDEALTLYDVLLYSNLPFDEIEFDSAFFNDNNYKLDSKYILGEVDFISNPDDYDDTKSSHPNIKKRRDNLISLITQYENTNRKKFVISKKDFLELQKEARFEMSNLYISNLEYGKAFYNSYLLLKKYPKNKFLKKTLAYTVYAVAAHKKQGGLSDVVQSYKKMEGQSQRVNYFFRKAGSKTQLLLAVKLLWNYHLEYPKDVFMKDILDDAMRILISRASFTFDKISPPAIVNLQTDSTSANDSITKPSFIVLSDDDYDKLSKYDKIRYDRKYQEYFGSSSKKTKSTKKKLNYPYILSTESISADFKKYFKEMEAIYKNDDEYYEEEEDKEQEKLNISRIILVNPLYFKVSSGSLVINDFEEKEKGVTESIKTMAAKKGIRINLVDIMSIDYDDVDKFNDLALMNSWLEELENLSYNDRQSRIIPWQSNYLSNIREKYNMRYIATMGVLDTKVKRTSGNVFWVLVGGVVMWPASPYFVSVAVSDHNNVNYFFYCVDLDTYKIVYFDMNKIHGKSTLDVINSLNYNTVYELNRL